VADTRTAASPIAMAGRCAHTDFIVNIDGVQAMLHYAVIFFLIALVAAVFGFGGIAASAVGIGKILFVVFAVLSIASFLFGLIRKS
jgi:uncharacterized membrane protein YtjA (UPF0391 family)